MDVQQNHSCKYTALSGWSRQGMRRPCLPCDDTGAPQRDPAATMQPKGVSEMLSWPWGRGGSEMRPLPLMPICRELNLTPSILPVSAFPVSTSMPCLSLFSAPILFFFLEPGLLLLFLVRLLIICLLLLDYNIQESSALNTMRHVTETKHVLVDEKQGKK